MNYDDILNLYDVDRRAYGYILKNFPISCMLLFALNMRKIQTWEKN